MTVTPFVLVYVAFGEDQGMNKGLKIRALGAKRTVRAAFPGMLV